MNPLRKMRARSLVWGGERRIMRVEAGVRFGIYAWAPVFGLSVWSDVPPA
jgi:hypothetical protein